LIEGIAHRDALAEIRELTYDFVIAIALHEDTRTRTADLARVKEHAHHRGRYRLIQIGIGEDDVRGLTAKFQRYLLKVAGGGLQDYLADLGRTGERDLIDIVMLCDRAAGTRTHAGDDVENALRQARFRDQFAEPQGGQRGLLGRLQDHGVATSQRGSELPGGHQQREIPRNDLAANSNRLAQRVVEE